MKKQKALGNKGFSLVELIVVIAIMAILVGLLAPTLIKYVGNATSSKNAANTDEIKRVADIAIANCYDEFNTVAGTTATSYTVTYTLTGETASGADDGVLTTGSDAAGTAFKEAFEYGFGVDNISSLDTGATWTITINGDNAAGTGWSFTTEVVKTN